MKKAKRIFAIVMTLMISMTMLFAMSIASFAAESYPITITNENATAQHSYTAYQVFAGTLSEKDGKKVLTNITWGEGVDGTALLNELKTKEAYSSCTDAASVAKVLEDFNDNSDAIEEFVDIVGKHLVTDKGINSTAAEGNKQYTINCTAPGYYIVKEGQNPESARSASGYMIQVVGPSEMNVKDQPMTPDKNILQNGETKVKEDTANVGDDVQFVVDTIKVPSTDGYSTFKFVMKDTLPKGLTYKTVDSVKLGNTTLTSEQYEVKTTTDSTTGKTELRVVFKDAINLLKDHEGEIVEIKYTATVNKDAEFGNTGNKNEVVFEFTNNPDSDSTGDDFGPEEPHGTTPESTTTTYVTKITVLKVDEDGKPLANAVFDLSGSAKNVVVTTGTHFVEDAAGTYYKLKDGTYTTTAPTDATADKYASTDTKYKLENYERAELNGAQNVDIAGVVSGTDGKVVYEGLKPGTYTITETGAPEGYNKLDGSIEVKIKFENKKFSFDGAAPANVVCKDDGTFEVTIENKAGSTLPSTGGVGTVIFYIVGSALIIGCGIVLVSRRRLQNNK